MMQLIKLVTGSVLLTVLMHSSAIANNANENGARHGGETAFVITEDTLLPVQHSGNNEFTLDFDDDSRLTFVHLGDGAVAMVELAKSTQPLVLNGFEEDLTPLEVYLTLEGTTDKAPAFLRTHHDRYIELSGQKLSLSNEQWNGNLENLEESVVSDITAPTGTAAPPFMGIYLADCSFQADGGLFDDLWQNLGWNWHWYYSGQADYKSTPSVQTNRFRTHLCNYNNGPRRPRHSALAFYPFVYISQEVPKGYRSYIVINEVTRRRWHGRRTSDYYSESGYYRLGAMAPP